jgi:hypothetical protein
VADIGAVGTNNAEACQRGDRVLSSAEGFRLATCSSSSCDEMSETGIPLGQLEAGFLPWTLGKRGCPLLPLFSTAAVCFSVPVLMASNPVPVGEPSVVQAPAVQPDQMYGLPATECAAVSLREDERT